MNSVLVAKILGWVQFGVQALGPVIAGGLPSGPIGWATLIGSLITAVAVHAAAVPVAPAPK